MAITVEDFEKQPYEEFFVAGDCYEVLETGETVVLAASTAVAVDKAGADVTSTVLDLATKALGDSPDGGSDNMLKVRCRAGVQANSPYKITFKMVTTTGNKWEVDVKMKVKEY